MYCKKKYDFSCFNWGIVRNGQIITVYAPYWVEGVILVQEECSTTPLNLKVNQGIAAIQFFFSPHADICGKS